MIVEIGTSDFRTQAGKVDGIFIEPVKYYFDKLPKCNKENIAISNYEGEIDIYYLTHEEIKKYNLPDWLRGCNSVNTIHPTTHSVLSLAGISIDIVRKDTVKVDRMVNLLERHKVTRIELLKIDTEGHDTVIINDYLDTVDILPKVIQFESNVLSNQSDVLKVCERLHQIGYKTYQHKFDMICELL